MIPLHLKNIDEIKPKEREDWTNAWKAYYKNQRIIKTFDPSIPEELNSLGQMWGHVNVDLKGVAFAVLAPLTFFHLADFKNKLMHSATAFFFMKNGTVVTDEKTNLGIISYEKVFAQILQRAGGMNITDMIPAVAEFEFLTDEQEQQLAEKAAAFEQNLEVIMEKFRKLPAVYSVNRYVDDSGGYNYGRLVEILVKASYPDETCLITMMLCLGDKIEDPGWSYDGNPSVVYEKWGEDVPEDESWSQYYQALVKLSNLYVAVPAIALFDGSAVNSLLAQGS